MAEFASIDELVADDRNVHVECSRETSAALLAAVRALPCVLGASFDGTMLEADCGNGAHNVADVLGALAARGVATGRIYAEPPTLNDVFLEITGKALRD